MYRLDAAGGDDWVDATGAGQRVSPAPVRTDAWDDR